ncbi:mechanosensitive ion channel [Mesorhizobium sp. B283B1A]|uniref:mechanosensitive ion channel family protein n=1 Tax=Mesorhizobium TaxID=68287 RepID=UPI001CD0F777|nr:MULTISPECIES: mechanosensitive ion channel domain-containing protein [Mesorhizobium]MCA0047816.1 mechanosensitive ion channel [Mesorhizobium sp. B283B1A]UQS65888.1 mechanosensitive ion channel [Mesorhizobium opportunistum]
MPIDPHDTLLTVQAGLAQLSTLIVSYSFSAIGAVILLVVGYIIAGLGERSIFAGLGHIHGFDQTLRHFLSKIVRYAILVLVVIMVLGQFGVQTASIIAALGAIGLAIGLALQGTLQNIAAGIMLLALRPFRIGESVEVGSIAGSIEEIGLFATKLRTADGVYILAPNSTLWNQPVRNFTRNGVRRADITLSIGSWNDIDRAQKALLAIAAAERRVKRQPAPIAFVAALGDSTVSITLRYWTSSADFFATQADLTKRAKQEFDSEGISIPLPPPEAPAPEAAGNNQLLRGRSCSSGA